MIAVAALVCFSKINTNISLTRPKSLANIQAIVTIYTGTIFSYVIKLDMQHLPELIRGDLDSRADVHH